MESYGIFKADLIENGKPSWRKVFGMRYSGTSHETFKFFKPEEQWRDQAKQIGIQIYQDFAEQIRDINSNLCINQILDKLKEEKIIIRNLGEVDELFEGIFFPEGLSSARGLNNLEMNFFNSWIEDYEIAAISRLKQLRT